MRKKERLSIIGTGVAGMGAAHHLQDHFDITLFEKNNYVGGHTNTVYVDEQGTDIPIDTGFMVFNKVTYPNLVRLFNDLKVPIKETDMSFSVQFKPTGLEYNGSGFSGLFAQKRNIFRPSFLSMLYQINRFNEQSIRDLNSGHYDDYSLKEYIETKGYGQDFTRKYIVPMSSAIWSTPMDVTLDFPFETIVRFMHNHGMLGMNTQHQWYTVVNGSETYKQKLIAPFRNKIQVSSGVRSVVRTDDQVRVITNEGVGYTFDKVIIAAHGDEALQMLDQPTNKEQSLLRKFNYQPNLATLHTDASIMPKNHKIWSAWNYRIVERAGQLVPSTIYYMNMLQGVSEKEHYFISINHQNDIDESKVIKNIGYTHPIFTLDAIAAQEKLHTLNEDGPVYFCGSYFKYGFHEDAYTSGLNLSRQLIQKQKVQKEKHADQELVSVLG